LQEENIVKMAAFKNQIVN